MRTTEKSSNKKKMANAISSMKNYFRNAVSKQRKRYTENGYNLDLAYICENIIAMGYPADNLEGIYRNRIDDVYQFLEETHPDNYKIYNLCSERSYDKNKFHGRVAVYPFTDHNPPTIELIQKFCDDIDRWLKSDEKNVAAVHCKAGKGRTGTMICCYLLHCGFKKTADDALGYYDEQRTKDKKGVTIPSQRRYVDYYSKLIRSGLPYQRQTLQLCKIRFSSAPLVQSQGSVLCSVSTLKDLSSPETVQILQTFAIDFRKTQSIEIKERIELTGDVKIELYQKVLKMKKFHFWFNTYFLNNQAVQVEDGDNINLVWELKKFELDAHKDKEHKVFAEDFTVQLILHPISSRNVCACNGNQQQNDNLFQQSQQQYTGQNQNHTTTNRNNHNNGSNSSFEYELEQQENQQQPDNQNMLQLYSTNNLILGNNTTTQQQNNQLHQKSHKLGPITNKFFDSSSVVVPTTKINPTNISGFPSDKNNINLKTTINKRQQHPLPPPSPPLHQQNLSSSVMPLSGTTTTNTTTSTIISSSIHKNHNINNSTINNSLNTSDSIIQSSSTNPTTTSSSMSGIKQLIDDDFNIDTISMKNKNSQNYLFNKTTNSSTTNNCSNVINQQQQHKDQHRQTTPSSINPDVSRTNSTSSNSSSSISSAASSSAVGEDWESASLNSPNSCLTISRYKLLSETDVYEFSDNF